MRSILIVLLCLFIPFGMKGQKVVNYKYWFDDDFSTMQSGFSNAPSWHMDLPIGNLGDWFHSLHIMVGDEGGMWSSAHTYAFTIIPSLALQEKSSSIFIQFYVDGNLCKEDSIYGSDGSKACWQIDVSIFDGGVHHWLLKAFHPDGMLLAQREGIFFKKLKIGDRRVVRYDYWTNDDISNVHVKTLSSPSSTENILGLLPVQPQEIRSSKFEFRIKDDTPILYARNDFHLSFYDVSGGMTSIEKEYIDEQVSKRLTNVRELTGSTSLPLSVPKSNEIHWFRILSEVGDSISIKLSKPCTIQMFSSSGKEVFHKNGWGSTLFDGIHAWENGEYYVAVHDMTGSGNDLQMDVQLIDKYDVLRHDVNKVGNGGLSTITFEGNGFLSLDELYLVNDEGDCIKPFKIAYDDDSRICATFDFENVTKTTYDGVFLFGEEKRIVDNCVTVEEAKSLRISTNVRVPDRYLKGTKSTCIVSVTNNGNMSAYALPLHLMISSLTEKGIKRIILHGIELSGLFDNWDTSQLSSEEFLAIEEKSKQVGSGHYFIGEEIQEGNNTNPFLQESLIFLIIPPYMTKVFMLEIEGDEDFEIALSIPEEWEAVELDKENVHEDEEASLRFKASPLRQTFCKFYSQIECMGNVIGQTTNMLSLVSKVFPGLPHVKVVNIADCAVNILNNSVQALGHLYCNENIGSQVRFNDVWTLLSSPNGRFSITQTIVGCAEEFIPRGLIKESVKGIGALFNINSILHVKDEFLACKESIFNLIKGQTRAVASFDPNDIYGYLSDAGCKFIADSVAKVNYTIEFENDTAFSQAAAHTVVIKDTLDSRYFDLKTFLPTGMKIGEREAFLDEREDVKTESGVTSFVKTIDMRPEIYAIAQVEGTYSQQTGIAEWRFTSLDPMTMEPTDDIMQGILPVNYDGTSGIGEVMFEIGVKANKGDGAQIANRAGIVFDYEEAILTPTWVNTVDAVSPASTIRGGIQTNDSTLTLRLYGEDERSGVWRYNVYAQFGAGTSWELVGENVTDTLCDVRIYEDIDYSFCVLATDSAGNVEKKAFSPEFSLSSDLLGDANGDGNIDLTDAVMITYHSLGTAQPNLNLNAADMNRDGMIDLTDAIIVVYRSLGIKVDELTIEPD